MRAPLKGPPERSEEPMMPSFMAFFVATLLAWIVRGVLPAPTGVILPTLIAGLVWILAFYFVRRWFGELRPDV